MQVLNRLARRYGIPLDQLRWQQAFRDRRINRLNHQATFGSLQRVEDALLHVHNKLRIGLSGLATNRKVRMRLEVQAKALAQR